MHLDGRRPHLEVHQVQTQTDEDVNAPQCHCLDGKRFSSAGQYSLSLPRYLKSICMSPYILLHIRTPMLQARCNAFLCRWALHTPCCTLCKGGACAPLDHPTPSDTQYACQICCLIARQLLRALEAPVRSCAHVHTVGKQNCLEQTASALLIGIGWAHAAS